MSLPKQVAPVSRKFQSQALITNPYGITPQGCSGLEAIACAGALAACGSLTGPALVACVAAAAPSCVKCI